MASEEKARSPNRKSLSYHLPSISCCFLILFGDVLIPSPLDRFGFTVKKMGPFCS